MNFETHFPLSMLVFQGKFLKNGSPEIFGLWYGRQAGLPRTRAAKKRISEDLKAGLCRMVILAGTDNQIEDLLFSLEWDVTIRDTAYPSMWKAIQLPKTNLSIAVAFDNIFAPKGTSVSAEVNVRFTEPTSSVISNRYSAREVVRLELAGNWEVGEAGRMIRNAHLN